MLINQDEPARVSQTLDAPHRRDATEGRQQHREDLGQLMGACDAAILGDFGDEDPLGLDLFDAGVASEVRCTLAMPRGWRCCLSV